MRCQHTPEGKSQPVISWHFKGRLPARPGCPKSFACFRLAGGRAHGAHQRQTRPSRQEPLASAAVVLSLNLESKNHLYDSF